MSPDGTGRRQRFVLWRGLDAWRAESASLDLGADSVAATGTQMGVDPVPYRLDYTLSTGARFVTEALTVEAAGEGWARWMRLARREDGTWTCETDERGRVPLALPGGDVQRVRGALDCDLARSPLTNLMPVRRHRLNEHEGGVDFLMAWVSVPDLGLHPSEQRYEHVRREGGHAVVRYVGRHRSFVGELVVDEDGIVEHYPELAQRVAGQPTRQQTPDELS